ncbi:MAG: HslU--HslV peptidase ATPase subunit, partial [Pseudomonadota bacterium]
LAVKVNDTIENIGARRLQTVLERLLDELSFDAPDRAGDTVTMTANDVAEKVGGLAGDSDMSKFIL